MIKHVLDAVRGDITTVVGIFSEWSFPAVHPLSLSLSYVTRRRLLRVDLPRGKPPPRDLSLSFSLSLAVSLSLSLSLSFSISLSLLVSLSLSDTNP